MHCDYLWHPIEILPFLLGSVPPDCGAEPLDARDEVRVQVDAGAGQVDAHEVRAAHAVRPPHRAGDLWSSDNAANRAMIPIIQAHQS